MEFQDWMQLGIDKGWISPGFCMTHEGDQYMSAEEEAEWEEGGDPCCPVFKVLVQGLTNASVCEYNRYTT